jgi:hypothetical protein
MTFRSPAEIRGDLEQRIAEAERSLRLGLSLGLLSHVQHCWNEICALQSLKDQLDQLEAEASK